MLTFYERNLQLLQCKLNDRCMLQDSAIHASPHAVLLHLSSLQAKMLMKWMPDFDVIAGLLFVTHKYLKIFL